MRDLTGLSDVRLAVTGAAPISPGLIDWFHAIKVPLSEVYGMSESTGVLTWDPAEAKPGTVGTVSTGAVNRFATPAIYSNAVYVGTMSGLKAWVW